MYAKLFASMYQGTLRGNTRCLLVFTNLLAHADSAGHVDIHPNAIADEVGLPVADVREALIELESPDDESRSPEEEGRRILRLDAHRAWGWRIVNHAKYRAIRNEEDRREQNREAQKRWRDKQSKPRKPVSAQAEAEAEAEASKATPNGVACPRPEDRKRQPDCPHAEILALWAEMLPHLPQHDADKWRGTRADHLRARWRETAASKGWQSQEQGLAYFRKLFGYVGQSAFLTGKDHAKDRRPFFAELAWLVEPGSWAKVHEGKYHQTEVSA